MEQKFYFLVPETDSMCCRPLVSTNCQMFLGDGKAVLPPKINIANQIRTTYSKKKMYK